MSQINIELPTSHAGIKFKPKYANISAYDILTIAVICIIFTADGIGCSGIGNAYAVSVCLTTANNNDGPTSNGIADDGITCYDSIDDDAAIIAGSYDVIVKYNVTSKSITLIMHCNELNVQ